MTGAAQHSPIGDAALDRETIERIQWAKLSRLLERTYATSPFYRRWLDQAGARPDRVRSLADFRKAVPLMRKENVLADQATAMPYGERLTIDRRDIVEVTSTGGTSGKGKEVYALTGGDVALISRAYAIGAYNAGIRPGDVVAMTFPMSMSGAPLWIYEAFRRMHANLICVGPYDTKTRLQLMRDYGARVLVATPSYIEAMAGTARDEFGWEPARDLNVDIILTATEAFSPERIRRIETVWGAKAYEWYGASQRIIAFNCEHGAIRPDGERGLLHHLPHIMMLETLHPETHEPVAYGEEGEVVATYLDAESSPLLRFATGDRVRLLPGASCKCSRCCFDGYESGTVARYDDMVKVRGVNIWPITTDEILFANRAVLNYIGRAQTTDNGAERVFVEVEFAEGTPADQRSQIARRAADRLKSVLGLTIDVVEAAAPLPHFQDTHSKARRWRDERRR
jgi:phenylacetate-CoA ligase